MSLWRYGNRLCDITAVTRAAINANPQACPEPIASNSATSAHPPGPLSDWPSSIRSRPLSGCRGRRRVDGISRLRRSVVQRLGLANSVTKRRYIDQSTRLHRGPGSFAAGSVAFSPRNGKTRVELMRSPWSLLPHLDSNQKPAVSE